MAKVRIVKEVPHNYNTDDWTLCFQWCKYIYDEGYYEYGYRFIWRRPDKSLQPARGQARIPSLSNIEELMKLAKQEGWLGTIENDV